MRDDIYIGRQPILDRKRSIVAYELLFLGAPDARAGSSGAELIVSAFTEFGLKMVLGEHRGFIGVDRDILLNDQILQLPAGQVALEILASVDADDIVVKRCADLKARGFQLVLSGVTGATPRLAKLLPAAHVLKVDLPHVAAGSLPVLMTQLRNWTGLKLAEGVETREQADECLKAGFDLFQGSFFSKPEPIAGRRTDPSKVALLKLLGLINRDAEVNDIEEELKRYPGLSFNLMRMVNSAASGLPRKIGSLRQGIIALGRQPIARWIQLLLYASGDGSQSSNPLLVTAATRGKTMEKLAFLLYPSYRDFADRAYMVGLMSLMDALLGISMQEVVSQMNVADDVKSALLEHGGPLGQLRRLIEAKEANRVEELTQILEALPPLRVVDLVAAELDAALWVKGLDQAGA